MPSINPVAADEPEAQSANPVTANLAALRNLFPSAFTEGKIDFDTLRQLLGDMVDDGEEKYGLNWSGKRRARRLALTPSLGTLRPAQEDSVDWTSTRNLMIEGDNLEVLKLLQKSYAGAVKLIYIDPPYNTGNDFVYPDDYTDSLGNYLRRTSQVSDEGRRNTSNTESNGRFHTDWLDLVYPRLCLARSLLAQDGLLAVSIDERESGNLRALLDDIFGEENLVSEVVWEKMYTVKNDASHLSDAHEYVFLYAKDIERFDIGLLPRSAEMDARYTNPDNDPRGAWKAIPLYASGERKNGRFPVISPTGIQHLPSKDSHWRFAREQVETLIADGRIYFGKDGNGQPNYKRFLEEIDKGIRARSLWRHNEVGTNDSAKAEIKTLFPETPPFQFPKPTSLIRRVIEVSAVVDGIILDFFAGSGTTGHAVMAQNAADGGNRRYILVQLPEPLDPALKEQNVAADFCDELGKPRNIAELTKERLRRAATNIKAATPEAAFDAGFRVYKLATSNLKKWQPRNGDDETLGADLLDAADNLLPGRTEEDLLTELLLKQGLDLSEPMTTRTIAGEPVHAFGGGVLLVCLGTVGITNAEPLADGVADWRAELNPVAPSTVFFKDVGFADDAAKLNVAKILEQRLGEGLLKVRSI